MLVELNEIYFTEMLQRQAFSLTQLRLQSIT